MMDSDEFKCQESALTMGDCDVKIYHAAELQLLYFGLVEMADQGCPFLMPIEFPKYMHSWQKVQR